MQAARGTSLIDEAHDSVTARATSPRYRWLFGAVALTAYVLDLASKQLAVNRLADGDVPVLGDWFVLHLTRNPGAAFSTGTDFTFYLTLLAIAASCVVLWFGRKVGSRWWAVGLGLLLGGVLGNLTDRLLREPEPLHGHVVDMFMVPNFPVFNVADICINIAAAVIVLQTFRGIAISGVRAEGNR